MVKGVVLGWDGMQMGMGLYVMRNVTMMKPRGSAEWDMQARRAILDTLDEGRVLKQVKGTGGNRKGGTKHLEKERCPVIRKIIR